MKISLLYWIYFLDNLNWNKSKFRGIATLYSSKAWKVKFIQLLTFVCELNFINQKYVNEKVKNVSSGKRKFFNFMKK